MQGSFSAAKSVYNSWNESNPNKYTAQQIIQYFMNQICKGKRPSNKTIASEQTKMVKN